MSNDRPDRIYSAASIHSGTGTVLFENNGYYGGEKAMKTADRDNVYKNSKASTTSNFNKKRSSRGFVHAELKSAHAQDQWRNEYGGSN